MANYSNLIFLLVQLLLVQSDDSSPNGLSQKLLTTRKRREILYASDQIPAGKRSPLLNLKTIFQQSDFKSQTKIIPNFDPNNVHAEYQRYEQAIQMAHRISESYRQKHQADACAYAVLGPWQLCGDPSNSWCCSSELNNRLPCTCFHFNSIPFLRFLVNGNCGTVSDKCGMEAITKRAIYIGVGLAVGVFLVLVGAVICHIAIEEGWTSLQIDRSTRLLRTENWNSSLSEPEKLIGNTEQKNSIVSVKLQPSDNINCNDWAAVIIAAQHIPTLLPSYDDVIQQNSVTIMIDQPSVLPPTYEDFHQKNN
ncbi:unnamed protein product [Adineta ricciae]|uniref:Uncharacterized protein n=1 Tax=Adineta ricciae TaxID=249248 RepID=A0A816BDH6_ADIRI|nr:unnamed protein product [Adineta ricciae]